VRDGYLLSEDVQEVYQDGTKVIQLSGTDGLELLKTIPFEFSADKPYSGVMTGLLLLDRCITPMGLDLNVNTAFNYYQNGQSKVDTFEPLAFFNLHAPLFEGKNCYDVLEMFTKTLRSCIFQEDGEWWFVHTQNPDGITQSYRKWDSDFNFISSDTFDVAKTVEFEGVLAPFDGNKLKKRSYKKSTTEVDLQGYLNQLKNAMKYVVDLNKEMTKIQVLQVEGAKTREEIDALGKSYNDLAQEMGVTTIQVAQGSVEWLRQGKTIAETEELLRSSLMLSKLGALESAEATDYLTSILNGFKLEAEDATEVIDKLINLDNNYATSAGEIANAMQRSANSAQQAGITFDELASYIK